MCLENITWRKAECDSPSHIDPYRWSPSRLYLRQCQSNDSIVIYFCPRKGQTDASVAYHSCLVSLGKKSLSLWAACPSTQPDNLIVSPLTCSNAILIHHTLRKQQWHRHTTQGFKVTRGWDSKTKMYTLHYVLALCTICLRGYWHDGRQARVGRKSRCH